MAWIARTPGPKSPWTRWGIVATLWSAYLALLAVSQGRLTALTVPLGVVPIIAGAFLLGWRGGIAVFLAAIPALVLVEATWASGSLGILAEANAFRWVIALGLAGVAGWGAEVIQRLRGQDQALREEVAGRHRTEEELRRAAAEYRALAENSPDLISRFNRDRKRIYANRTVEVLMGRPREALLGGGLTKAEMPPLPAGILEKFLATMNRVFKEKQAITIEAAGPTSHGPGLFETRIVPEFSPDGSVDTVLVLSRDITQERQATSQLQVAHSTLKSIIDSSPMPVVHSDLDGTIRLWNGAAERLFGWTAAEAVGRLDPLIPESDHAAEKDARARLLAEATVVRQGLHRITKDMVRIPVDAYLSPILAPDGTVQGVVTIFVDLRERQRAKEGDELKALQGIRQRFLNTAAHELNTPLTPIRLTVSTLQRRLEARLTEQERAGFQLIDRNLDRFTQLVQDLLDATRLQGGHLRMQRQRVHIDALTNYVLRSFEAKAQADGIALTGGADETEVEGDESRLSQVLVNLVHNALKFTPRGGKVALQAHASGDGVDIEVTDTGMGMLPTDADRIFQPFLRLESAAAKPGTGLGLFICKGIVEKHGGQVTVTSPGVGRGTTFHIHLPSHPPATLTATAAA